MRGGTGHRLVDSVDAFALESPGAGVPERVAISRRGAVRPRGSI